MNCILFCLGWADTWDGLREAAGTIQSVKTDFTQTKHLPILAMPLVSKGHLYFQSPESLRWEYRSPIASILLMHDGRIRRFTKDTRSQHYREESASGLDAMQVVMEQISQWLGGRFDTNPYFDAALKPDQRIVLTPKQTAIQGILKRVELHLGNRPGMIRRVVIYETETAYTDLVFEKTVLNQAIAADVFQKVP
jgi:outer membrane lipoprotein-sorting protein